MTWLDWVDYYTQWVWNVHLSSEWWNWVYNDEKNIENCSRKYCEKVSKKKERIYKVRYGSHNSVITLLF